MPFLVLMCMFFSIPSFATELTDTGGTETNNVADSVSLAPKDYVKSPWFDYSELSDRFMTKNGEFGSYGRLVIQAMQRVGQKCFHETIDFSKICPGYKGMTVQKKDQFMVFLFASIALHDANNHMLGAYKKIQTNQGRASWNALKGKPFDEKYYLSMPAKMDFGPAGLFGINVSVPARKASRRPQPYCFGAKGKEFMDPAFQIPCAVAMFSQFHCQRKQPLESQSGAYWYSFRKGESGYEAVSQFPGCK